MIDCLLTFPSNPLAKPSTTPKLELKPKLNKTICENHNIPLPINHEKFLLAQLGDCFAKRRQRLTWLLRDEREKMQAIEARDTPPNREIKR
jgi:hypothetical protein